MELELEKTEKNQGPLVKNNERDFFDEESQIELKQMIEHPEKYSLEKLFEVADKFLEEEIEIIKNVKQQLINFKIQILEKLEKPSNNSSYQNINISLQQLPKMQIHANCIDEIIQIFSDYLNFIQKLRENCFDLSVFNQHKQELLDKSLFAVASKKFTEITDFLIDAKKINNEFKNKKFEKYFEIFEYEAKHLDNLIKGAIGVFTHNAKLLSENSLIEDKVKQLHKILKLPRELKEIKLDHQDKMNQKSLMIEDKKDDNYKELLDIIDYCHGQKIWFSQFKINYYLFLDMQEAIREFNEPGLKNILKDFVFMTNQRKSIFTLFDLIQKQSNQIKENSINIAKNHAALVDKLYDSAKAYVDKKRELKTTAYTTALKNSNKFGHQKEKPAKAVIQVLAVHEFKGHRNFRPEIKNNSGLNKNLINWNPFDYQRNSTESVMEKFINIEREIELMLKLISNNKPLDVYDFIKVSLWQLFNKIKEHPENKNRSKSGDFFDDLISLIDDNRHFNQFIEKWLELTFYSYSIVYIADGIEPPILLCDFEEKLNHLKYFLDLSFKETKENPTEKEQLRKFKIALRNFVMLDKNAIIKDQKNHKENNEKIQHFKIIIDQGEDFLKPKASDKLRKSQSSPNLRESRDKIDQKPIKQFSEGSIKIIEKLKKSAKKTDSKSEINDYKNTLMSNSKWNQEIILSAAMPHKKEIGYFNEEKVSGKGGNCGFYTLGAERNEVAETLSQLKNNKNAREKLCYEIRAAFQAGELLPPNPNKWRQILLNYTNKTDELNRKAVKIAKKINPQLGNMEPQEYLQYIKENGTKEQNEKIAVYNLAAYQAEEVVKNYCQRPGVFEYYVNAYRGTLWLGYESALLYGKQKNISVFVWQKDNETLKPIGYHIGQEGGQVVHMLLTNGFTHFNLLVEANLPENKKNSDPPLKPLQGKKNNHKKPIHKKRHKRSVSKNPQLTHQQNDDFLQSETTDPRNRSHSSPSLVEIRHNKAHQPKKTTVKRRSKSYSDKNRDQENKPLKTFQPKDDNETTENRSSFASILIKLNNKPTKQDHLENSKNETVKINNDIL